MPASPQPPAPRPKNRTCRGASNALWGACNRCCCCCELRACCVILRIVVVVVVAPSIRNPCLFMVRPSARDDDFCVQRGTRKFPKYICLYHRSLARLCWGFFFVVVLLICSINTHHNIQQKPIQTYAVCPDFGRKRRRRRCGSFGCDVLRRRAQRWAKSIMSVCLLANWANLGEHVICIVMR